LKSKQDDQLFKDLIDMYTSHSRTYPSNTVTATDLEQLRKMLGLEDPLTAEEKQELENLKSQYANDLKVTKLNIFKKQSSQLRQYVINSFLWQETVNLMNSAKPSQSVRINELENKTSTPFPFLSGSGNTLFTQDSTGFIPYSHLPMPNGISIEELQQAHVEATIEEEMLYGEKS